MPKTSMKKTIQIICVFLLLCSQSSYAYLNPFAGISILNDQEWNKRCMALTIYHEARGEPLSAQLGVGYVVLSRKRDRRWPDDICEVVYQKKQWEWTFDNLPDLVFEKKAFEKALAVATIVLHHEFPDITKGANHVYSGSRPPWWAKNMKVTLRVGKLTFLKG